MLVTRIFFLFKFVSLCDLSYSTLLLPSLVPLRRFAVPYGSYQPFGFLSSLCTWFNKECRKSSLVGMVVELEPEDRGLHTLVCKDNKFSGESSNINNVVGVV